MLSYRNYEGDRERTLARFSGVFQNLESLFKFIQVPMRGVGNYGIVASLRSSRMAFTVVTVQPQRKLRQNCPLSRSAVTAPLR